MLEHVSLGQARFMTPGVAPDFRGIVLGRYGLIQFSTLEGVVSWFRVYSSEASLDELLLGMEILRVRTSLQNRELLLKIPAISSHLMDAAARTARLVGGTMYTGTGKHYVKYRDDRSPYGYDAADISALPSGVQLMLHNDSISQNYYKEGELSFEKLIFRLSLKRQSKTSAETENIGKSLVLAVERGLGDGVMRYLWRNQMQAEVVMVRSMERSAFDDTRRGTEFFLLRVSQLPERILDLFQSTPGIEVFRPLGKKVAIQFGYSHVFDLDSCDSVFNDDRFYLFRGSSDRIDVMEGPLKFSAIEHLMRVKMDIEAPEKRRNLVADSTDPVSVSVRLAPTIKPPSRVVGTLISITQAVWLKKLIYLLPPSVLRGHGVAVTDRGILLVADSEIDVIPLGELFVELAPGLLIPAGMEVVPRVTPDVFAAALGHTSAVITVFPQSGAAFQIGKASMVPLGRRALETIPVEQLSTMSSFRDVLSEPTVVNDPVGRFALWGFKGEGG